MIKKVLVVILVLILTTPVYADADRNEFIKNMTNLAGAIKVTKMFCKASNGVDDEFRRLAGNYGGYLDKQQHLMTDSEIKLLGDLHKKAQKYWAGIIFSDVRTEEGVVGINDAVCRTEVGNIKILLRSYESQY